MSRPVLLVNLAGPTARDAAVVAAEATAAGFDGVGLADSPRLYPDPFIETDRVLAGTATALAGPCVAALGLRHPATVASSLATLGREHGGRLLAVVGRGESSVRNEGLPVPGLHAYGEMLTALVHACGDLDGPPHADRRWRAIGSAGEALVGGRLFGAASGPRTIALTAERLGGVLIDVGVEPSVVAAAIGVAREANPAARCWLFVRAVPTRTPGEARAAADPVLGSCAARMAASPGWYGLDADLTASARRIAENHDYRLHGTAGARGEPAGEDAEAEVRDRFVLTGEAARLTARVAELTRLGAGGFIVAGALRGVPEHLADLGTAFGRGFAAAQAAVST